MFYGCLGLDCVGIWYSVWSDSHMVVGEEETESGGREGLELLDQAGELLMVRCWRPVPFTGN